MSSFWGIQQSRCPALPRLRTETHRVSETMVFLVIIAVVFNLGYAMHFMRFLIIFLCLLAVNEKTLEETTIASFCCQFMTLHQYRLSCTNSRWNRFSEEPLSKLTLGVSSAALPSTSALSIVLKWIPSSLSLVIWTWRREVLWRTNSLLLFDTKTKKHRKTTHPNIVHCNGTVVT
jgi:hypothetical protein